MSQLSAQAIKEKLQGELDELETELRIHLPKEIKRALEFGDLRENSEYRAALDRQNVVKARIVELRQRISEIASIDPNKVPRDKASYGSTLVLYDAEKDEEVTYRLVTPEESNPPLFGKANRRADTSDALSASVFEDFRRNESGRFRAVEAIERLLRQTKTRHIILSYSSGGRATADELNDVINSSGKLIDVIEIDYKRNVMGGMRWTHEWVRDADEINREFLFLIERI